MFFRNPSDFKYGEIMDKNDINVFRNEIDTIDKAIILLISKRIEVIKKIGEYKKEYNLPVYNPEREKEVITSRNDLARGLNLDEKFVENIIRQIIEEAHNVENRIVSKDKNLSSYMRQKPKK